jgi:hypothetical protein
MDTFKNFAIAQVITPPAPPTTGTSLTLTPGATVYLPPVPFTIAVFDGTTYATPTNAELIRVTAIVGDTLAGLVRAYEGSTARTIVAGDYVAQTFTAQFVADVTNSGNQSAGTLPDARLSANVPLKNAANTFTANQQLLGAGLLWSLTDPTAPADARIFLIRNTTQVLALQSINDAATTIQGAVTMDRSGVLTAAAGLGPTPLNASQLTSGTVPDARQSSNVALKNIDNHFVAQSLAPYTTIQGANSILCFTDTGAPSNARCWRVINYGDGLLRFEATTDNFAAVQSTVNFNRDGSLSVGLGIYERGRTTPMGQWTDLAFSPGNFSATGGTWTIGAAAVVANRYTLIGKTLVWSLYISWFSGANVVTGPVTTFNVSLPAGLAVPLGSGHNVAYAFDGPAGPTTGLYAEVTSAGVLTVKKPDGAAFVAGNTNAAFGFIGTFMFAIA